jgi:hypothetical protein
MGKLKKKFEAKYLEKLLSKFFNLRAGIFLSKFPSLISKRRKNFKVLKGGYKKRDFPVFETK